MTNAPADLFHFTADDSWKQESGRLPFTLTNDYLFRAVLQLSNNTLKSLLSALLEIPLSEIISCEIQNPIILGSAINHKTCVLDVRVLLNNNQRINLEMQVGNLDNWQNRAIFYLSKMFCDLKRGDDYSSLLPSIHIGILSESLTPKTPYFYSRYMLSEVTAHQIFSGNFSLHVLDLSQLDNVSEEERSSELYRWARIFKATTWEELQALTYDSAELQEGISYMYELTSEDQIRWQCFARELYEMDQQVARKTHEKYKNAAELAKLEAEQAQQEAEQAQREAEQAQQEAKQAQQEAEQAKQKLKQFQQKAALESKQAQQKADLELKQAQQKTESRINSLNQQLIHDNRMDDLIRSAADEVYQQQLLLEYGLIPFDL